MFFCLSWLWHFWGVRARYILGCLSLWACLIFSQEWIEVMHLWQECHRGGLGSFSAPHLGYMRSVCLTAGDVNLDFLVKVLSSGFSCKITFKMKVIKNNNDEWEIDSFLKETWEKFLKTNGLKLLLLPQIMFVIYKDAPVCILKKIEKSFSMLFNNLPNNGGL